MCEGGLKVCEDGLPVCEVCEYAQQVDDVGMQEYVKVGNMCRKRD